RCSRWKSLRENSRNVASSTQSLMTWNTDGSSALFMSDCARFPGCFDVSPAISSQVRSNSRSVPGFTCIRRIIRNRCPLSDTLCSSFKRMVVELFGNVVLQFPPIGTVRRDQLPDGGVDLVEHGIPVRLVELAHQVAIGLHEVHIQVVEPEERAAFRAQRAGQVRPVVSGERLGYRVGVLRLHPE